MLNCVSTVHRKDGSHRAHHDNRRQYCGLQFGRSQTEPPDQRQRHQILCEGNTRIREMQSVHTHERPFDNKSFWAFFQAANAEARELWKGFIQSVSEVCFISHSYY